MQPKHWLKEFLDQRQLTCSDGRSLYCYRMDDEEFEKLKASLKTSAMLGVVDIARVLGWNAAFVIYAAEWWRREYDGSKPSWEKVFASFNSSAHGIDTQTRNQLVRDGLKYWNRKIRIINGRCRYLGTVAIEGGLPLNQLLKSSGWLGKLFKQVIPKYIHLQHSGLQAYELIGEYEYIPETYQNEQIYAILGDMVQTVAMLKKEHQLHERNEPISYLDQHVSEWREFFPLPVDTEIGQRLLSDIITTAAKTDESPNIPFHGSRQLCEDYSLKLKIEFSKFITLENIFKDKMPEAIPSRLEVEIISNDGLTQSMGVALKTTFQGKTALKMSHTAATFAGDKAIRGYSIRFKHLSEIIADIPLASGEALDNDIPWVFSLQNGDWLLEGVASICTRAKQVKVFYPGNLLCIADNGAALVREVAKIADKKIIEATGIIKLTDNQDISFIIKTAQAQAQNYYYLQGKSLNFPSVPKELYMGLPKLWCVNSETERSKEILPTQLIARPVNSKGKWSPLSEAKHGVYEIRLQDVQGNIQFRKKCVLLPDNFAVRFKPAANSLGGIVYLENTGHATVSCEIHHTVKNEENSHQIELYADDKPPSHVNLTLKWSGMTEILNLTLPFPARGGQIIDADGNKLSSKQPLFQERLHGVRLRLFNESPNQTRDLRLEFGLADPSLENAKDLYFRTNLKRKGPVIELAIIDYLEWIKELLAIGSLDSHVDMRVYEGGSQLVSTHIYRYQMKLDRNLLEGSVFLNPIDQAILSPDEISAIQLMAMRLSQPEQQHIGLEAKFSELAETGSWLFHPEKRAAEPWLIYPNRESSISLRPILWDVKGLQDTAIFVQHEILTLHSAVVLANTQQRHDAIKNILGKMSLDFEHSGWDYLRNLWSKCPHLPLSSFDVWTLSVSNTKVLAALILKMDEAFLQKLSNELPVFWELIPLNDWLIVFGEFQVYLQKIIDDAVDVQALLESRINRIGCLSMSMEIIARILKQSLCNIPDQELNLMKLPFALKDIVIKGINDAHHELNRRQADSQWLEVLKPELIKQWKELKEVQQLLKLEHAPDHHLAILILPVLLAAFCLKTPPANWVGDATHIFKLKQLKAFDEDWFNTAFKFSLAYLSQQQPLK